MTSSYLIGRSCRVPGANDVAKFRSLLRESRCAVTEIPPDRWRHDLFLHPRQGLAGKSYTFAAGVLDDIWGFDLSVFNLSPREVVQMDPQQRLLLQVVWEALEDARLDPNRLSGERVGVYVGASSMDHGAMIGLDPSLSDAYMMTGNTLSLVANRISHAFDWRGPNFVVDTACSSSMVALDLARQALDSGEIEIAVVAGANLLLNPVSFVGFSAARMLSPTGLCRSFSDQADGYVRAEGAVAVVLRRADDVPSRAIARLVASDTNADGRTVNVALPSEEGQFQLLTRLYDRAEIDPEVLSFVEAHGTGTLVGDPIEAHALGRALASRRTRPLVIGSVKSNVGHLEPASGLVGLLKTLIAFEDRRLPATLHVENLNPHVNFEKQNLAVAREAIDLPVDQRLVAGVSSFGFGGINGHCIVESVDAARVQEPAPPLHAPKQVERIFVTSAFCSDALRALAEAYAPLIAAPQALVPGGLVDQAWHGRGLHPNRLGVLAASPEDAAEALWSFAAGERHPMVIDVRAHAHAQPPVFVYSGNGAQYVGMSRLALEHDAEYARAYRQINDLFMDRAGWNLLDWLASDTLVTELDDCTVAQSLLFADQAAQTTALRARGIMPAAVMGHSGGEVAAAWSCGALDLFQAVDLVVNRSQTGADFAGAGTMAALQASAGDTIGIIAEFAAETGGGRIEIAAINSPNSVTIVGPVEPLKAFSKWVRRQHRLACIMLPINYPYHSSVLDAGEQDLKRALRLLEPADASCPFFSSTLGREAKGSELDKDYWWRNLRQTVRFEEAVKAAAAAGYRAFLEIGAQPVLTNYLGSNLDGLAEPVAIAHSLSKSDPETVNPIARAAMRAVLHGIAPTEGTVFVCPGGDAVTLPAYPWQKTHLRATDSPEIRRRLGTDDAFHPLLGMQLTGGGGIWRRDLDAQLIPSLADHLISGSVLLPATAFAEMAFAAATRVSKGAPIEITDLDLSAPLVLSNEAMVEVQTRADPDTRQIRIESRRRLSDEPFREHMRAHFAVLSALPDGPAVKAPLSRAEGSGHRVYRAAKAKGMNYGPAFQRVKYVHLEGDVIEVGLREGHLPGWEQRLQGFDPVAVDCLLHGLFVALEGSEFDRNSLGMIPIRIERVHVLAPLGTIASGRIEIIRRGTQSLLVNLTAFDASGAPALRLDGLRLRALQLVAPIDADTQTFHVAAQPCVPAEFGDSFRGDSLSEALSAALPAGLGEDDALLLMDAATHEAIWAAFNAAVGPDRRYDLRHPDSSLEPSLLGMIARLGLAVPVPQSDSWDIAAVCDIPPSATLADALLEERCDLIGPVSVLLQLPIALAQALDLPPDGLPGIETLFSREPFASAPFGPPVAGRLIAAAFDHICGTLTDTSRVRLGIIGPDLSAFQRMQCRRSGVEQVRLRLKASDSDPNAMGYAASDLGDDTELEAIALGDPALLMDRDMCDRLVRTIRPGGKILVLCQSKPALTSAVQAFETHPAQPEVSADSAARALEELGLVLDLRHPFPDGVGAGELIVATRPAAGADVAPQGPQPDAHPPTSWPDLWESLHGPCQTTLGLITVIEPEDSAAPVLIVAGAGVSSAPLTDCILALRDRLVAAANQARALTAILPGGAAYAGGPVADPNHSALWAVLRTASNEYPGLKLRMIDTAALDASTSSGPFEAVGAVVRQAAGETEIVLTATGPQALRVRQGLPPRVPDTSAAAVETGLKLATHLSPRLDAMRWKPMVRTAPGHGEVEIEIVATGLNYRDVMWGMGLLPEEALENGFAGPTLGFECSGRVARIGSGVTDLAPGDPVIAFGPACFASHLVAAREWVTALPEGQSLDQAAALPVAYFTSHYALRTLGELQPGETVLIHGGAGGVGLAAIAVAQKAKARIIATAGNPVKQTYLRKLGVDHVISSRDPGFAAKVRAICGEKGVDVVLNSLAGQAMDQSLALLRPYGRFLELGKQDFYSNTNIGLRLLKDNIAYHGVDVDHVLAHRPKLARRVFAEVVAGLTDGSYPPLPYTRFEGQDVVDAFRFMQRSAHIGRIIISPPDLAAVPKAGVVKSGPDLTGIFLPDQEGWHVIAGGLGGLGLEAMEWLDVRGAKRIALLSRRADTPPEAAGRIDLLRRQGVDVRTIQCDISDAAQVSTTLATLRADAVIASVFHTAMVLEDRTLPDIDADSLERTLKAKTAGLLNLDQATRSDRLQAFVAFTSLATLIGNPGQSAYVAANAHQEAVIRARHSKGLPALAVAWGAISDAGYVNRDAALGKMLHKVSGNARFTASAAFEALGKLLMVRLISPCVTVTPMNWGASAKLLAILKGPTHELLRRLGEASPSVDNAGNLRAELQLLPYAKAVKQAAAFLKAEIAAILRVDKESLSSTRPLTEYGMDSLMGVELGLAAQQALGDDLPQPALSDGLSIERLAELFVAHIQGNDPLKADLAVPISQQAVTPARPPAVSRIIAEAAE